MRTIETMAIITADGELILQLQLPIAIAPGQHRVVLIIEEQPAQLGAPPLHLEAFAWPGWPAEATFRREKLYDDNGR
jgi:hypothetical protein